MVFISIFVLFLLGGFNLEGNVETDDLNCNEELQSEAMDKWVEQVPCARAHAHAHLPARPPARTHAREHPLAWHRWLVQIIAT